MSKRPNQKLKLLYLMRILWERTDPSHALMLSEISEELAKYDITAERKSLYDDIEALRLYGLDIQVERDRHVRYYVNRHHFSLAELKLLSDAIQSSRSITTKKSSEMIRKLEALGSRGEASLLREQVYMENRLKATNEEIFANVGKVYGAISENQQITFRYFDWNARKQRILRHEGATYRVSPWALCWHDENYYLIAYDNAEDKIKHFRVDKMIDVVAVQERRLGDAAFADFDMAVYARQIFGMYGGELCNVRIRCANALAGVVIDRFGTDVTILLNTDNYFEFSTKVMLSPTFYAWILGFGNRMRIISPDTAAEELCRLAREALATYETKED